MLKRYCRTILQKWYPCSAAWAVYSTDRIEGCYDEPMSKNCHNIVDDSNLRCPTCRQRLEASIAKEVR